MKKQPDGPFIEKIPLYNSLSHREILNVAKVWNKPLSGYLGGGQNGGRWVERLSHQWQDVFGCDHAVPCNSATSGLLATCMAAGVGPGDDVWVSAYTMSATASAPMVLGANVIFKDVEISRLGMDISGFFFRLPKAIIVTNLFGHPAMLRPIRKWCDEHKIVMIEDNAQGPLATEGPDYAGTIGHMGVFSLNVHKHIQCGEGGIVVTNNSSYYHRLLAAINHGELVGLRPGLNLRMTEPIAAIACSQLTRAHDLVEGRRRLAYAMDEIFDGMPWGYVPKEASGCKSARYVWYALINPGLRSRLVRELNRRGFPMKAGYITPLHKLFNVPLDLPSVEDIEEKIIIFETCAYNPNKALLKKMKQVAEYVLERLP